MRVYPATDECISDHPCELIWHRFCHSPAAETIDCRQDLMHSFKLAQWSHDVQVNVMEFVACRWQQDGSSSVVFSYLCHLAALSGLGPVDHVFSHVWPVEEVSCLTKCCANAWMSAVVDVMDHCVP